MPFFIPGKTVCALCGKVAAHRVEVAQLPLVNSAKNSAWGSMAWRFAHRRCWRDYTERNAYAQAARELVLKSHDRATIPLRFERNGLFLLEVPAARAFRVKDVWGPLEADIPIQQAARFAEGMSTAIAQHSRFECALHHLLWILKPHEEASLLTLVSEEEPIEEMDIPLSRRDDWIELMRTLSLLAEKH